MSTLAVALDLHNHTCYSLDGVMSPKELLLAARTNGIHCLAVTDHDSLDGALEAWALAGADSSLPRVIPGIEVSTAAGEIIGLYVTELLPRGLPLAETVASIKAQGGLVYLPHPFDLVRRGAVTGSQRAQAAELADIIEVANGRSLGPRASSKAARLARKLGKPGGAGSDAHRPSEVGSTYVVVSAYPTPDTLAALLERGMIVSRLGARRYTANWGLQGLAPVTRMRRRLKHELARR